MSDTTESTQNDSTPETPTKAIIIESGIERSKHTPGPWKACPIGIIAETFWPGHNNTFKIIAKPILAHDTHTNTHSTFEAEANALLIAAAPDLLAACVAFIRFSKQPNSVPRDEYIAYQVNAISGAESAIAKATA